MTALDRDRRSEIAREALDVGMDDPYWLCNLKGRVNTDDMQRTAEQLREDAELIETAQEKIDDREWTAEEAALYIAENANLGDYETDSYLYDSIPITEE
ncbi:hypothetical protein [Natronoarchaeum rubrum]|uniref:hypothetical protein n=1 Tax=Natronoarchaeum rubrum TaxID=755311 RepID=UPI002111248B|nr:hypothetical protein [Natronoarchaeum rubrum]